MKIIRFEYKIAAIYLLIGFLWIYLTDSLLEALVSDAELLTFFQSIKGSIYVGVTGLLLFVLIVFCLFLNSGFTIIVIFAVFFQAEDGIRDKAT